jgi:hypothetical protein
VHCVAISPSPNGPDCESTANVVIDRCFGFMPDCDHAERRARFKGGNGGHVKLKRVAHLKAQFIATEPYSASAL